jgi:hypothetical protein
MYLSFGGRLKMFAPERKTAFDGFTVYGNGSGLGANGVTRFGVLATVTERENGCCTRLFETATWSIAE